jgi:hypothetical protein
MEPAFYLHTIHEISMTIDLTHRRMIIDTTHLFFDFRLFDCSTNFKQMKVLGQFYGSNPFGIFLVDCINDEMKM